MSRTSVRLFLILLAATSATSATGIVPARDAAAGPQPAIHEVVIEGLRFDPQELIVKAGDTIVWTNHDPFPHTVSALGKHFNSREIAAGGSWKYKARSKGVFDYTCLLHSNMAGRLLVQ
jgi:plastocyanin